MPSNVVRFKAVLRDGSIITGPIMGNGGMLCAGVVDPDLAKRAALNRINYVKRTVGQDNRKVIYQPEPDCVAIYPNYSAEGDGEPVAIPLLGTEFSIQGAK